MHRMHAHSTHHLVVGCGAARFRVRFRFRSRTHLPSQLQPPCFADRVLGPGLSGFCRPLAVTVSVTVAVYWVAPTDSVAVTVSVTVS
eukprot:1172259-Prorocentrum_minimum.AAC.1